MIHASMEPYVRGEQERPRPHPSTLTPEERRAWYREQSDWLWPHPEQLSEVREVTLDLGTRRLAARLYVPGGAPARGLVLYFHGGSFVAGDLDTHDGLCRRLALDTGWRFLSVDYRLAPEHAFPAPVEDARDAIAYVSAHREQFVAPNAALVVMGDSAGATLAAVGLNVLRGQGVDVRAQVLIYPTLGPDVLTGSGHDYGSGFLLDVEHLRYDYTQYLGAFADETDERVSPLLSADLSGVPPAIIVVAECDPLRDEAVAYAGLLEHFGVPVQLLEAHGMIHGFLRLGGLVPEALAIVDDLADHLGRLVGADSDADSVG